MASNVAELRKKYPNTAAVAELFDTGVCVEPIGSEIEAYMKPVGFLFALADPGDSSVGIAPTSVTPTFPSMEELETFCAEHREEFEHVAVADEISDRWFWEEPTQAEVERSRKVSA